jgi:hypothetical protein
MWGRKDRPAVGRNRQAVRRYILQRWLESDRQSMLVICQKDVEKWLRETGLPEGIAVEHFNAISGLDQYKHVRSLILIGRTIPAPAQVEAIAGALTGVQPVKMPPAENGKPATWYGRVTRGIRMADGTGTAVEADQHPDPVAEALRWQICEAELMQALGRARAINRDAGTPLTVDIVADVVLPITVDATVDWEEPSALVEAAVEGIVLNSPGDMSRVWPAVWATARAAKWALKAAAAREKDVFSGYILYLEKTSFSLLYRSPKIDPPTLFLTPRWIAARDRILARAAERRAAERRAAGECRAHVYGALSKEARLYALGLLESS